MFERTQGLFANIVYDIRSIHIDIDTQTAIVEAKSSRTLMSTGEKMTIRYVFIYRFARDLIVETHEYIHPLDAQSAMKAMEMVS